MFTKLNFGDPKPIIKALLIQKNKKFYHDISSFNTTKIP